MGVMPPCILCGRELPEDGGLHPECWNEHERRDDAGMCVLCDKHEQKIGFAKCAECIAAHNSTYTGYPGGA